MPARTHRLRRPPAPRGATEDAGSAREPSPGALTPSAVLALQRTAGNRAVQQILTPAGARRVQRRMGLEFETGVAVRDANREELPYDAPIAQAKGWEIKADSSNMEFVTRPLDDEKDVAAVMGDMLAAVEKIDAITQGGEPVTLDQLGKAIAVEKGRENWKVTSPGSPIAANPQVTFGVPLESMMGLMEQAAEHMVSVFPQSPAPIKRNESGAITQGGGLEGTMLSTEQTVSDLQPSYVYARTFYDAAMGKAPKGAVEQMEYELGVRRIAGLLTLVFRYLNDFWATQSAAKEFPYAKASLGVLSRSDFHSMYASLDKKLRAEHFTIGNIALTWGVTEAQLKAHRTHERGFTQKGVDANPPHSDEGMHYGYPLYEWLGSIIDTTLDKKVKDDVQTYDKKHAALESSKHQIKKGGAKNLDLMSRGAVAFDSNSMGSMGMDADDPSYKAKLAVIEFRQLITKRGLAWPLWRPFAEEMFGFYVTATAAARTAPVGGGEKQEAQEVATQ